MTFSKEEIRQFEKDRREAFGKYKNLLDSYSIHNYDNPKAKEYAHHGFLRRLNILAQCVDNIFSILPPDRVTPPEREELLDANISLQAFVFNVFGSADNLAWIWVLEKNLTKSDGTQIPKERVGLRKQNKLVRDSFTEGFQDYLKGIDEWFDHIEDFRHALGHRIPLYILPFVIAEDKIAAYRDCENRMADAQNIEDYERLSAEQNALGVFLPVMTHSFEENAKRVLFHPQVLADFNRIIELGQKLLEELDR